MYVLCDERDILLIQGMRKHDLTHRYRDTVGIYCFSNVHITLRNELRMDANKLLYQSHAELCFGLRIHTICR